MADKVVYCIYRRGHHGFARFGMFDTHLGIGQLDLGEFNLLQYTLMGPAVIMNESS